MSEPPFGSSEPPELPLEKGGSAPPPPVLPELGAAAGPFDPAVPAGEPADWRALLGNRLVLSGLAAVAVLGLVTIVLVTIGNGDGGPRPFAFSGAGTGTPEVAATALPDGGLTGEVRTTTAVRNGPGLGYDLLGTIRRGALVSVVGRDATEGWLQVVHPPGSSLRGWISRAFIEVSGDVSQLTIAEAGEGPSIVIPTSVPTEPSIPTEAPVLATATGTPAKEPTATPTPEATEPPTATPEATEAPAETPTP